MGMRMKDGSDRSDRDHAHPRDAGGVAPGKRTLTGSATAVQRSSGSEPNATGMSGRSMSEIIPLSSDVPFADSIIGAEMVQRSQTAPADEADVQALAAHGTSGASTSLPFVDQIQRSFGAHDVSEVKAHTDGAAAEGARGMGATAFASGDRVAFADAPDLHTAAHEAAHVVQQRQGVSLKGGVGQAGDPYEQHADAVADAVVAGRSAEALLDQAPGSGSSRQAVQRFGSREHKDMGDIGSGEAIYGNQGMGLTHGDLVMLRGDYFEEDVLRRLWDRPSMMPGRMVGTQDELIYAIHHARSGRDDRFLAGGMWQHYRFSSNVKSAVVERYNRLATMNQDHFVEPKGTVGAKIDGMPVLSAPGRYRDAHERALMGAYRAGIAGASPDPAFITEAMGQHFLTDAFASGHITTPRGQLSEYWNKRYPRFGQQFVEKLVTDLSRHMADHADMLAGAVVTAEQLEGPVRKMILEKMASKPPPTLGELLSLITHDYDNVAGVNVVNDLGWRWNAVGDGEFHKFQGNGDASERQHSDVIIAAIAAGCDEIRLAYSMGQNHRATPLDTGQLFDQIRQQVPSPAKPSEKYAAEQYMPRPDPKAYDAAIQATAGSLEELWRTPVKKGGPTYGQLISKSATSGTLGSEMEAMIADMPAKIDPIKEGGTIGEMISSVPVVKYGGHGWIYPQRAFRETILNRLRNPEDGLQFMLELTSGE
ncbi:MAG: DUF4157 domain-containing protein [Kofleriaceae bacterium]|nr:MAG: DUF4157 domain-containing protein [Kofleriaceae bacterium]